MTNTPPLALPDAAIRRGAGHATTQQKRRPLVGLGLIGSTLDRGTYDSRWNYWRPTVSLFMQPDLLFDRFELFSQPQANTLAQRVVDDIALVSPHTQVRLHPIDFDTDPWDFERVYAALHDMARAYPFDTDEEDYLLHITTGTHVAQICLFLLTESRHIPARLIQTSPDDRLPSPATGQHRIIDLDLSRYDRLFERFERERDEGVSFLKAGIDTKNQTFNRLIDQIERVAIASRDPILLCGPTGAGKTQLARRIYDLKRSRRQVDGRFVEVNCATLRGDAAMSALFGHVKGAFTGAIKDRAGLLQAADGGVLFLDEIGELGLDEQAMLLRAIEAGVFMPVGADDEVSSRFQLLAGTNRDLGARVRCGEFREDLLARIDLWTFELPGLQQRPEDIEPNLDYELERFAQRTGQHVTLNREAREAFLSFATGAQAAWRGNFRDLNAAVTRMATLSGAGRINAEGVAEEIQRLRRGWRATTAPSTRSAGEAALLAMLGPEGVEALDRFDRVQLADVVAVCRESASVSAAGRALFSESRKTKKSSNDADRLRKYLARHGLDFEQIQALDEDVL